MSSVRYISPQCVRNRLGDRDLILSGALLLYVVQSASQSARHPSLTSLPPSLSHAHMPLQPEECSGDAVEAYEQCGGDMWEGATCCEEGLECVQMGDKSCYWQVQL